MVHPFASLPIASHYKVSQITFHPSHPFLAIQSHDRSVELFRIRTEEEVRKKQARRLKRAKEKKETKKSKADGQNDERADNQSQDLVKEVQLVDLYTPYTIVRTAGKVRSFDFVRDDNDAKHVQVRFLQTERRSSAQVIHRYLRLHPPIRRKCSLSHCQPKARMCPSLLKSTLWTFQVIERIFERSLSALMTNCWQQHRMVSSIY